MANTTNFGWETPDDTDLVKDGAAAIRTLGSAIDTSLVDLKGGTSGQVLSKTSNTDMDFTWTTITADITEVNAGVGISGGGTSGAVTITNSMATAIDAKGDLIAGTGADTFSRLAIGANDTVLTADSSQATGLKWATVASGGMTLLSTTTLSSTSTNITGISGSYNDLLIIVRGMTSSTDGFPLIKLNNSTSTTYAYKASGSGTINNRDGAFCPLGNPTGDVADDGPNANFTLAMRVFDYAQTSNFKVFDYSGYVLDTNQNNQGLIGSGVLRSNSAVTSVTFTTNNGTYTIGGTVLIYGVK